MTEDEDPGGRALDALACAQWSLAAMAGLLVFQVIVGVFVIVAGVAR